MALMTIVEAPDSRLRQISKPVEAVTAEIRALVADMFETMYEAPGIGLAAIQVGHPLRLLIIDLQEEEDAEGQPIRNPRVFINPELSEPSEELSVYNEGCLSVPEHYAEIERPKSVRARWTDEKGKAHDEVIDGMLATCLQHEIDHLNGMFYIDHLPLLQRMKIKREVARRKKSNLF